MEKKKFNRGTMTGGIVRIAIALVAIIIAVFVFKSAIGSYDPEEKFGTVFIGNGIKMIIDGKKSLEVGKKGHSENGRIIDLTETEVTENNNGSVSRYTIYNLKFEYTDDFGNLCESQEQVSLNVYEKLRQTSLVPILVYKERAIFDKKRFDAENV